MIINEKYFKEYSPIPLNFSFEEIKNYIRVATKIWVKPVIGENLLNELEEQVAENNISPENATLLTEGGLWQYLSFATTHEALPMLWARMSEVGIVKGKTETADSLTLKELTLVQQHLRNQTEVLKDQLKRWLCEHQATFPLVDVCACGCDSCCDHAKLNKPNPLKQMHPTLRADVDIR